MVSNLIF